MQIFRARYRELFRGVVPIAHTAKVTVPVRKILALFHGSRFTKNSPRCLRMFVLHRNRFFMRGCFNCPAEKDVRSIKHYVGNVRRRRGAAYEMRRSYWLHRRGIQICRGSAVRSPNGNFSRVGQEFEGKENPSVRCYSIVFGKIKKC
jgi:hypothetical protein